MIRIFNTLYLPQDLRRVSVSKPLRLRDPLDDFAAYFLSTTGKAAYNGGGKSAPSFRNIEIIRYRYFLYKHPYMSPTKSTYHPLPPPLTSPSNPSASSPSHDALRASFHEF